jgi:hypothetical protein
MIASTLPMRFSTTSRAFARESPAKIPRALAVMRLLDRQFRLLDYLTSSGAVFGEEDATLDPALQGMDPRLLRLEARFSYEKRMEKIIAVFPKTFRLLEAGRAAIVREFVNAYPPTDITRIENARQFYDFLSSRWRLEPPEPSYLEDVAACEFACARVRVGVRAPQDELTSSSGARRAAIRRHPDSVLVRCAYNIRPIFENDAEEIALVNRDTPLAIAIPRGADQPKIFEMPAPLFELLVALDNWTDRSELEAAPGVDALISEFEQLGLIEVRG